MTHNNIIVAILIDKVFTFPNTLHAYINMLRLSESMKN